MELKNNNSVKYIDVEDGSCLAYVRCDTTEAAQAFTQKSNDERHVTVLEGKITFLCVSLWKIIVFILLCRR